VVATKRDLCDRADVGGSEADFCRIWSSASVNLPSQLVVLVGAIGKELAVNYKGRVQGAAGREVDAADVLEEKGLLGDLRVLLLAHDASGASPTPHTALLLLCLAICLSRQAPVNT